jgi:hypothetical protein
VLDVELWAELRREHFVRGVAIKELVRRTGATASATRRSRRSGMPDAVPDDRDRTRGAPRTVAAPRSA